MLRVKLSPNEAYNGHLAKQISAKGTLKATQVAAIYNIYREGRSAVFACGLVDDSFHLQCDEPARSAHSDERLPKRCIKSAQNLSAH